MKKIKINEVGWIAGSGYKKQVLLNNEDLHCEGALVQIVRISPGNMIQNHYHRTSFEVYCPLEGSARLFVNEKEFMLKPGSFFLLEPDDIHRLINDGKESFVLLVFKTNSEQIDTFWP